MQSRILLRGYAREGGTPSLATHPQNQEQQQNQNQQQNQGRLHRGLDTPVGLAVTALRCAWSVYAFVILSNHLHVVLKTPQPNLARGMQAFLSKPIQAAELLMTVNRFLK